MATIASLLRDRVSLQVNSVDRIFLAGYIPKLQSEGQIVRFLLDRGFPIPSPAALGKISQAYARAIERFAARERIPVVHFKKGESKELVARRYMHKAERDGRFGVVMIGVAQEKASAWKGYRSGGSDAHPHFCYRRMSVFPNYFYIYIRDREFGPAFIKSLVSYCTSWGCWCGLWLFAPAALLFDEPGVAGGGRLVEAVVAVVELVVGEQPGALPVADRDGVNVESFGELVSVEHAAGAEPLAVAGDVVGVAEVDHYLGGERLSVAGAVAGLVEQVGGLGVGVSVE